MIWQQVIYRIPNWSSLLSIHGACAGILPNSTEYTLLIDFKILATAKLIHTMILNMQVNCYIN